MQKFFVDYENVGEMAFSNLERVQANDIIFLFYTSASKKQLPIDKVWQIQMKGAALEYVKVTCGSKNALDFQLSSFIGWQMKMDFDKGVVPNNKYIIVSHDKGYFPLADFWSWVDAEVVLSPDLGVSVVHNFADVDRDALLSALGPVGEAVQNTIVHIVESNESLVEISNELNRVFKTTKNGSKYYKQIKGVLVEAGRPSNN